MQLVTSFPNRTDYAEAVKLLDAASLPYRIISPDPGYAWVGVPGLVVEEEVRARLASPAAPPLVMRRLGGFPGARPMVREPV